MNGFAAGVAVGVLSIGAVSVSPIVGPQQQTASSPAPTPEKLEQSFHLDVYLRDSIVRRENAESREVRLVRACLDPVLARVSGPMESARAVRTALESAFSSRVTVEEEANTYKAVYDAETKDWHVICCSSTSIEIDLDGTVVSVPVTVGTVLD